MTQKEAARVKAQRLRSQEGLEENTRVRQETREARSYFRLVRCPSDGQFRKVWIEPEQP